MHLVHTIRLITSVGGTIRLGTGNPEDPDGMYVSVLSSESITIPAHSCTFVDLQWMHITFLTVHIVKFIMDCTGVGRHVHLSDFLLVVVVTGGGGFRVCDPGSVWGMCSIFLITFPLSPL